MCIGLIRSHLLRGELIENLQQMWYNSLGELFCQPPIRLPKPSQKQEA
jgi:hypothetical protein